MMKKFMCLWCVFAFVTITLDAQTDNEETKEDLVDILIDRLQVDENSTERFVVEDAIKIIWLYFDTIVERT